MSDEQFPDDLDQYIAEQKERDPEFETIFEAAVTRRYVEINTRIRQKAWEEYLRRETKGYTPKQLQTFLAGMFVMWRLCGLDKNPLFTFGPDSQPNNLER